MLNSRQNDKGCDTTGDYSSNAAGKTKKAKHYV
jgi:hypothetical protein